MDKLSDEQIIYLLRRCHKAVKREIKTTAFMSGNTYEELTNLQDTLGQLIYCMNRQKGKSND